MWRTHPPFDIQPFLFSCSLRPEPFSQFWARYSVSREAEIPFPARAARYVRLAFHANPANRQKVMKLDEVWIMGLGE
jgi:hypothetical protein